MKDDKEKISSVFKKAEWDEVPLSHDMEKAGLNGIFVSGYAAVGEPRKRLALSPYH